MCVHRLKDARDDVRAICTRHLDEWIAFDATRPLKVEYLKYLGWMCSDYSHKVRMEAVKALHRLLSVKIKFFNVEIKLYIFFV